MAESNVSQTVRLAPFQEEFLANIFGSAEALTGEGSQMPFSKEQLAGFSEGQLKAIQNAMSGIGSYAPYIQGGADAMTKGIGAVDTGLGTAGEAVYDPTSYKDFMNPYLDDVIQQQYKDISDKGVQQQKQLGSTAVGSGAFGGSRHAVAQGQLAKNVMDQQARTGSQLRSQGFSQAQTAAQNAAQQKLNQAQLTGALGQTMGGLGMNTAGLGQLGQQLGVQDINTLLGIGGLQQGQSQKEYDVARRNELAEQGLPYEQVGFLSDIFRGVPALQQTYTTTSTPNPSTTSQLLGLGQAGLGAYGMMNQGKGFNFFT